jgi:hypothetical protein
VTAWMKRLLWMLPVIVIAGFLLPLAVDDWQSACGCIEERESFAVFVAGKMDAPLNASVVATGFQRQFPIGTELPKIQQTFITNTLPKCQLVPGQSYTCKYWLEFNKKQEHGYEVAFQFGPNNTVSLISAREIFQPREQGTLGK